MGPRQVSKMSVSPRIDPPRFSAGCRKRRLNHGLVVAVGLFASVRWGMFLHFLASRCMLCLLCYLFVISTSVIDCRGRSVPEMTCYVLTPLSPSINPYLFHSKLKKSSFPQFLSTIVFLTFHPPDWLHGLPPAVFVFFRHVGFNFGTVC